MADHRTFVLDSIILLQYIAGDSRVEELVNRISDGVYDGYMLEQGVSEIYEKLNEKLGIDTANRVLEAIKNSRIKIVDTDYELMKKAGELKAAHKGRISMMGAYMIALAKNLNAVLVTCDENIVRVNEVKTEFVKIKL
ncbi:MAG: PIN domain-containing protein [Nitrososphaerales archaeon]